MAYDQAAAAAARTPSARDPLLDAPSPSSSSSSPSPAFAAVGDSLRDASPHLQGLDRAVVVTGVSRGIGAAVARCLAAKGYHVFGTVRRAADAEQLELSVGGRSGRGEAGSLFTPLVLDVCDADAVAAAAARVAAILGPRRVLAGLVNNAGIHVGSDPVALLAPALLRRQLEVNLVAPLVVTQAFLPLLGTDRTRDRGRPGRIFMMSSVYGCYGVPWNVRLASLREGERGREGGREGERGRERERERSFVFFSSTPRPPPPPTPHTREKKVKISPQKPKNKKQNPLHFRQGAYSASKFGLEGLTEVLRREIRLFGIGVTSLRPGPVSTDIWSEAGAAGDAEGYWSRHSGVDGWGRAMELSRRYLTKEFAKRGWFWPAERIGDAVVRILDSHHSRGKFDGPAAAVLTPGFLDNWLLPMWLPAAVTDGFIAMKFGVAKVLPRIPFEAGGGGEAEAKKVA